jgi:hypothetical protein
MVASDESYFGGGRLYTPTLAELCRDGTLNGSVRSHKCRMFDDYSRVTYVYICVAALVMMPIIMFGDPRIALGLFVIAVLVPFVAVNAHASRHNRRVRDEMLQLKSSKAIPIRSGKLVADLIIGKQSVVFHQFLIDRSLKLFGHGVTDGLKTINLGDADHEQITFAEFLNDHDRVMFRLGH